MSLEPAAEPERLYLAVGADINSHRPLFTGDIFPDIEIPGVGPSTAIVIGHPCSIRGKNGQLAERMPVAAVKTHAPVPTERSLRRRGRTAGATRSRCRAGNRGGDAR